MDKLHYLLTEKEYLVPDTFTFLVTSSAIVYYVSSVRISKFYNVKYKPNSNTYEHTIDMLRNSIINKYG